MVVLGLGMYYVVVIENYVDFYGKVVVDVGVGSGIFLFFVV